MMQRFNPTRLHVLAAACAAGGAAAALTSHSLHCDDDELAAAADECLELQLQAVLRTIEASGILPGEDERRRLKVAIEDYIGVPAVSAEAEVSEVEQDRCRICGCGEESACVEIRAPEGGRRNCAWADETHTLCDNPDCLTKAGVVVASIRKELVS